MSSFAVLLAAFGVSVVAIGLLGGVARRWHWVDKPGGHKHHAVPVPVVGGMGIALALLAVAGFKWANDGVVRSEAAVFLAALAMLALGLWDDRHALSPRLRFVGQALSALLLAAFGGALLIDLGALLDGAHVLQLQWFAWPMTVFCVVGVMNACNMSDGMDGSAGTLALLALTGVLIMMRGGDRDAVLLLALAGALCGFLMWNLPLLGAARVYLGDGGSLLVGALLGWMLVALSQGEQRVFAPAVALWLYAPPLIDTVSVMWRRAGDGRSPFQPDQRHVHHLLLRTGIGVRRAWAVLLLYAAVCVSIAVAADRYAWSEPLLVLGFLLLAFLHHALMRRADRKGRLLGWRLAADIAEAQRMRVDAVVRLP